MKIDILYVYNFYQKTNASLETGKRQARLRTYFSFFTAVSMDFPNTKNR